MTDPRVESVRRQVDAVVSVAAANRSTAVPVTLDARTLYYLLSLIDQAAETTTAPDERPESPDLLVAPDPQTEVIREDVTLDQQYGTHGHGRCVERSAYLLNRIDRLSLQNAEGVKMVRALTAELMESSSKADEYKSLYDSLFEEAHFRCDCISNPGPTHCHRCSNLVGHLVFWKDAHPGIKRIEALNRLEVAVQAYMETHNHVYVEPRCGMAHPYPEWRGRTVDGAKAVWEVLGELEAIHG